MGCLKWKVEKEMSEANYKLIRDIPRITHTSRYTRWGEIISVSDLYEI